MDDAPREKSMPKDEKKPQSSRSMTWQLIRKYGQLKKIIAKDQADLLKQA